MHTKIQNHLRYLSRIFMAFKKNCSKTAESFACLCRHISSVWCGKEWVSFCLWNPVVKVVSIFFCFYSQLLRWCVEIPGFSIAQEIIFIVGEAAEEEGTAYHDNGSCPAKAISPVVIIPGNNISLEELPGIHHWVNNQGDDLKHSSKGQQGSNHSKENKHLWSTKSKEGEDETDDENDAATHESGSRCSSPGIVHKAPAVFFVGASAPSASVTWTLPPEGRSLRIVIRFQPASSREGYDIKDNGAKQKQG